MSKPILSITIEDADKWQQGTARQSVPHSVRHRSAE